MPRKHNIRCSNAKSEKCNCSCNGDLHGTISGIVARKKKKRESQMDVFDSKFSVGEIVYCRTVYERSKNKKGFVEEILKDPRPPYNKFHSGRYSVYGLEQPNGEIRSANDGWYFGDYVGAELETTGNFMSVSDLENYKTKFPNNKGVKKDIDIVIKNLKRSSGRNLTC